MSERFCSYRGDREQALVAYLYGDVEPDERSAFESHLATCEACSTELAGLGTVRARLEQWVLPEPAQMLTNPMPGPPNDRAVTRGPWYDVPTWMQALAAMLFLGATAGAANIDIKYNQEGLSVRTGWLKSVENAAPTPVAPVVAAGVTAASVTQADLATLEQTLRREIEDAAANPTAVRRVRTLVAESERKQENELALRIAALYRDFQTQRTADLVRVERNLNTLSNNTGLAVQQQRESIRSLQVRLTQKQ